MKHLQSHQVWEYLDGDLDAQDALAYDEHISACYECKQRVEDLRRLSATMSQVMKAEVPRTPPEFHANVVTALHQNAVRLSSRTGRTKSHRRKLQKGFLYGFASAAAVMVAAGIGWYTLNGGPGTSHGPSGVAVTGLPSGTSSPKYGLSPKTSGGSSNGVVTNAAGTSSNTAPGGTVSLATTGPAATSVTGQVTMSVQDSSGMPLTDAHVAFVANGRILGTAVTDDTGSTSPVLLTLPTDPVMAPTFTTPGQSLQGDMTVVVWKQGYRPVVSYDVRVFEGGLSAYSQAVTLHSSVSDSSSNPQIIGYGTQTGTTGYHLLSLAAYVDWAKSAPLAATSNRPSDGSSDGGVNSAGYSVGGSGGQTGGRLSIDVVDQNGHAVTDAHVAVIAGDVVSARTQTTRAGQTGLLATPGIADWRYIGPWNVGNLSPRSAAVVVWKQGYAPAIGLYVPLSTTHSTAVKVKLQSLAWRQSQGMNNLDAPTEISPERMPGEANAAAYVSWVTGQGY